MTLMLENACANCIHIGLSTVKNATKLKALEKLLLHSRRRDLRQTSSSFKNDVQMTAFDVWDVGAMLFRMLSSKNSLKYTSYSSYWDTQTGTELIAVIDVTPVVQPKSTNDSNTAVVGLKRNSKINYCQWTQNCKIIFVWSDSSHL